MNNCYDNNFVNYYFKYLNYDGNENFVCSKDRENCINVFYYPIIIAFYNNKIIYSISPTYYEDFKKKFKKENLTNKDEIVEFLKKYFKDGNISIQEMIRMTKTEKNNIDVSSVININEKNKDLYYNSFEYNRDLKYKEKKWKKISDFKYIYGIVRDNKIASLGFVSNIDYNAGNIVIQTKDYYQNRGYGKKIVEKISRSLLKHNIMPIYWVNIENKASIKLANIMEMNLPSKTCLLKGEQENIIVWLKGPP